MKRFLMFMTLLTSVCALASSAQAGWPGQAIRQAHADRGARWYNANHSWHGNYAHVQYGQPLALIVPPTANFQTEYSWGVGRTTMSPIHHQFDRPVAVPGGGGGWSASPVWPSNTRQLGVYSVRGPW